MPEFTSPLDNVHIAAPCSADWNEMNGDEQVRYCSGCRLNVYNLSEMTTREAKKLLIEREGRLCVRFYQRTDGTIITQNCPRGIAAIKRRLSRTAAAVFSTLVTFASGIGIFSVTSFARQERVVQGNIAMPANNSKRQNNNTANSNRNDKPVLTTMGEIAANFQVKKPKTVKTRGKEPRSNKSIKKGN